MTYDDWPNLATMFFDIAGQYGDRPFLWDKLDGSYVPRNWASIADEVRALSAGLRETGVESGDRVVLVAENGTNWVIADLAIIAAGAITVPAYTTNTEALHEHVLNDSGARLAIVSTAALAKRLLPACTKAGTPTVIAIDEVPASNGVEVVAWSDILVRGAESAGGVEARAAEVGRKDTACFIYTSGTGGMPKGVILSHHAVLSNIESIYLAYKPLLSGIDTFLSFLPLSHSYEHTAGLYFPISIGAEIYYAEGADTLINNMPEARPTIMTCVPRLYEVMRQRILAGVNRQGGKKKQFFERAVTLGTKRINGERLSLIERVQDRVLDKLVRSKVRERFGGRLNALVSGGAPLNPDVGLFFSSLGLTLLQGYGQTESAPVVSCNLPDRIKMDTVGHPLPGVEVRIADDGEILVRGGLLMDGYWNNPETTAETIKDGWLHTGDIGEFDSNGYLKITDRKKDLIVNSGGDNIAPQRVEGILNLEPEIAQAVVVGDRRPYLAALIVPDDAYLVEFAKRHNLSPRLINVTDEPALLSEIRAAVDRANQTLSAIEKVKRVMIASEAFTVDNGQMTPTMKVRRHAVKEVYGTALDSLYG
ncbi:MAG: long-chain fatty acid--CoA ligase [Alphaproteobacteria bacterium]|jgi:long-chain acyl-CoA synthetase|nr:long-chain fatty acid--CoA ligase [Rhodospirillaceae bacterium]MBT6512762.1 long-chain fatty acid--CoA ligase [Rhodospirillaceae bacterium]MDG2479943.1 long-chain fatty acid--CoA ligase [Alphaproteobacteria bacterium]